MEIFEFEFMRRAFLAGILLAIIIPCTGIIIVLKRLSLVGDALSHSSLAGVAAGLVLGINPIVGASIASVIAALSIEAVRRKFGRYSELAVAVVLSASVGLAGVLSGLSSSSTNFSSFLFGSIVAISDFEMALIIGISLVVISVFLLLYKELFYISFDERSARLAGINVSAINFIFVIITALTVSIASRTVGALIVSSMMVIPATCAMQISKSYKITVILSIAFALFFTVSGLFTAYYLALKPGGTIVLIGVITLGITILCKNINIAIRRSKH